MNDVQGTNYNVQITMYKLQITSDEWGAKKNPGAGPGLINKQNVVSLNLHILLLRQNFHSIIRSAIIRQIYIRLHSKNVKDY